MGSDLSSSLLRQLTTPGEGLFPDMEAALQDMREATDWDEAETSGRVVPRQVRGKNTTWAGEQGQGRGPEGGGVQAPAYTGRARESWKGSLWAGVSTLLKLGGHRRKI